MGCILPSLWVGKENMCSISLALGQIAPSTGWHLLKNDDRFASLSCLSLSVAALPVTRRGSNPPQLWKIAESKQNIVSGRREHERRLKSNNNWMGLGILMSGDESYCVTSVHKPSRVWDWQMSKSWPKMNALITTHIQMYEVMKLRDL